MIIAGLLAALPGFLLKLAGSGLVDKVLDHKRKQMDTATEQAKIGLQREIKQLENEQDRRKRIAELQALEYQHKWLWIPKAAISLAAAQYIVISLVVQSFNLTADYNIVVPALSFWQEGIVATVVAYIYLKS